MLDTRAASPHAGGLLADSYRRLIGTCDSLRARVLTDGRALPDGWLRADQLADRIRPLIEGEARRIRAEHGCVVPVHVAGSRLLHHYLWSACLLMSGPWYLEGRVPALRAEDVWIEVATGDLAVRPGGFASLERGCSGERELRAVVADHVAPVLDAFGPALRRGPRALRGMVTDDLLSGIWYLGRILGEEERAVAEACALLPEEAAFRRLPGCAGRSHLTRTRQSCCLYYAVTPTAEACLTCPRTADSERLRRLES